MEAIDSSSLALSPSFSHLGTGRHSNQAISESSLLATPHIVKTGNEGMMLVCPALTPTILSILVVSATERRLQPQTPADTVLTHFRIVRYVLLVPT